MKKLLKNTIYSNEYVKKCGINRIKYDYILYL